MTAAKDYLRVLQERDELRLVLSKIATMTGILCCPACNKPHDDEKTGFTEPHREHQCASDAVSEGCGHRWVLASADVVERVRQLSAMAVCCSNVLGLVETMLADCEDTFAGIDAEFARLKTK